MMHDTWRMMHDDDDDGDDKDEEDDDQWLQTETPGVTHFGAYNRPPDGHFFSCGGYFDTGL